MPRSSPDGPSPAPPDSWQLWLGSTLDLTVTLATSDCAELVVHSILVFPDGWALTVDVGVDRFTPVQPMDPMELVNPNPEARGGLRFGLRFADGTRALPTLPGSALHWLGGSAHDDRYWVDRAPDGTPIDLIYEYPSAHIARGTWTLEGELLTRAAQRCTPLWSNRR